MKPSASLKRVRCAVYTRKSHEEGLQLEFNSLDQQREAAEAYTHSVTFRAPVASFASSGENLPDETVSSQLNSRSYRRKLLIIRDF